MNMPQDHPDAAPRTAALEQTLKQLGWTDGRNLKVIYRWGGADVALYRRYAAELIALAPDVIVAAGSGWIVVELQRATAGRAVPIVLAGTIDPVVDGFVQSVARPGGNITGFSRIDYGFATKWLELLKQTAPNVTRVAALRDNGKFNGDRQVAVLEKAAPALEVELSSINFVDAEDFDSALAAFASQPNGGLVVTAGTWATVNSELIIALAAKHRLPAVYPNGSHVVRGGLISYGPSIVDEYRRAAEYVNRILRGAKPADLPVQRPTRYETVLNMKTAQALGLEISDMVQVRADHVIE